MSNFPIKPTDLKRIVVIGSSCAGKTTLAKRLAGILNYKHIEMDAINWLPNWEQRKTSELREIVEKEVSKGKWVLDGNYSRTRDIVWHKATHIIWLNYAFPIVFYRSIKRTTGRVITQETICGGNRETFKDAFLSKDSMILWVLRTYHSRRRRYKKQVEEHKDRRLNFLVFKNSKKTDEFIENIEKDLTRN